MPQSLSKEQIIQRMIDAGESEENIAAVIQHMKDSPSLATGKKTSLMDMFKPTDPNTGAGLRTPIPKNAPRVLGTMAGLASQFIPGLGLAGRVAAGTLTGAVGEGVDEAVRGEPLSLGNMATEGAEQGVIGSTEGLGKGLKIIGSKMHGFNAGPLTKAATGIAGGAAAHAVGVPSLESAAIGGAAAKYGGPAVENAVNSTGYRLHQAGEAIDGARTAGTNASGLGNATVKGSRAPMLPDALRRIQLLVRALTNQHDQD